MMGFGGPPGRYGLIRMLPYEVRRRMTANCAGGHHGRCTGGNSVGRPEPCPCPCHGPEESA